MKSRSAGLMFLVLILMWGCQHQPQPPIAQKIPKELKAHGDARVDDYYWLRERENPEVLAYLEAENAYTQAMMAHTEQLQKMLYDEMVARIKPSDVSVPVYDAGYYAYERDVQGQEYPVFCRKKGSLDAQEEVVLDVNQLAQGHAYFATRGPKYSPNNQLAAYATDSVGRRKYTIAFRDLTTGKDLDDTIAEVTGNMAWANDSQTLWYTKQHPETLRPYQVWAHVVGTASDQDRLIYQETDETFGLGLKKSKSKRFVFLIANQTLSTEVRLLDANHPDQEMSIVQPRERGLEYEVAHLDDRFIIRTNLDAENFRLVQVDVATPGKEHWQPLVPHRPDVFLKDVEVFRHGYVMTERKAGLTALHVKSWDGQEDYEVTFDEPAYSVFVAGQPNLETNALRYVYTSLTTPPSTFEYDLTTRERKLLKEEEVLGGFDKSNYVTERHFVGAQDGAQIPLSLVFRKGFGKDGSHPALLYGYGSYGYSMEPHFESPLISLLDRGFVYAIAHVRGGQEMGRHWYEDGKLLHKKNTFTDFNACAEFLKKQGYAGNLFAMGGSAGGLLMGAIINMRPDLYEGVVAAVPWVDVVTTMLDDSIPLTTSEYDEWGNPNDKTSYDYMLSYSPYDNVKAQDYPNLLVLTGLHDSQVQYWEPAKWVAKLRAVKTDDHLLLLKTDMQSGHSGTTGRFKAFKEEAFIDAFILDLAGIQD